MGISTYLLKAFSLEYNQTFVSQRLYILFTRIPRQFEPSCKCIYQTKAQFYVDRQFTRGDDWTTLISAHALYKSERASHPGSS